MLNIVKQFRNATYIDSKKALFYNIEYLKYWKIKDSSYHW